MTPTQTAVAIVPIALAGAFVLYNVAKKYGWIGGREEGHN